MLWCLISAWTYASVLVMRHSNLFNCFTKITSRLRKTSHYCIHALVALCLNRLCLNRWRQLSMKTACLLVNRTEEKKAIEIDHGPVQPPVGFRISGELSMLHPLLQRLWSPFWFVLICSAARGILCGDNDKRSSSTAVSIDSSKVDSSKVRQAHVYNSVMFFAVGLWFL